jgi:hypothetical protein
VAGTTVLTLPAATDTLVGKATTDTLTNKTLTGAAMNGTVGATTPATGAFTTLSATGTLSGGTSGTGYSFSGSAPAGSLALDASGNLGLGQVPAVRKFEINAVPAAVNQLNGIRLQVNGIATSASEFLQGLDGGGVPYTSIRTGNDGNGYMNFFVGSGPTERARITSSGDLLVGTTTYNGASNTAGFGANPVGQIAVERDGGAAGVFNRFSSDGQLVLFRRQGTTVGSIDVTTILTTYTTTSDYRLKNITGPVTGAKDFIMALQPKQGTWKADSSKFVGFLAHEFQEVSPSSVTGEKDAVDKDGKPVMQSMQASSAEVMANLVAFVQEQQALITQLTARITALETT